MRALAAIVLVLCVLATPARALDPARPALTVPAAANASALSCKGGCDVACAGGSCALKCETGASCLLRCQPGAACDVTCEGTLLACEDGVLACDHECP